MARIDPKLFAAVIMEFLASPKFKTLADATQDYVRRYLIQAAHDEALGAYPSQVMRPSLVQGFLDGYADRPGAQINAKRALCFLEKWAIVRDRIPFPITTGTEVIGSDGGHLPWSDAQIATAEHYAIEGVSRLITLAANTGQRRSDLYRMHPNDVETVGGRPGINVLRRKNKDWVPFWIPFTEPLIAAMKTWPRTAAPFLLDKDGKPFCNAPRVTEAWRAERDSNPNLKPCAGLVLHGLRSTAVIRLRRAGCTPQQISDLVGLSVQMIERYCRFADQKTNAIAALDQYERRTGPEQERNNVAKFSKVSG